MSCKHAEFFNLIGDPQSNREYWIFTETFVYLHGGKDYCNCQQENTPVYIGAAGCVFGQPEKQIEGVTKTNTKGWQPLPDETKDEGVI